MAVDLHIHIDDGSPESLALESIVSHYRLSPEEAVKRGLTNVAAQADPERLI